ncbi:D-lactate dehydrogenase (cytochrome) [Rhodopseudomonas julia]|uniref:D-lactate dehydrogenase (cytochrome) n=1 Tax=Rhodopseudomonas julia TaxID=200617 RepID=A0ABU0C832_9BRAD|nr:FAD-linked oxidase C-terminal domain-containing protein [Rhodopseudomonas julia]MDQ0326682.1 D-lactate dehydrogenase (cytochrome) [Rhodopseudomonas julia]
MAIADALSRNEDGISTALGILAQRFGERFSTSAAVREQHGHTTTWITNQPPDGVVFVHSTEEVAEVVRVCAEHHVPIIPFGTGSSLEGHLNAPAGGVSIDLSGMKRILAVHGEDLDCVVEPGVTRKQLNEHLRDTGLFFPIDPGADASLGGMASTRASGTNAVRYGTMKDNVLNLTAVMPDGSIVRTAQRAKKTSAGYDLTRLLVGAEGTLGVITELTLRLQGIPEAISAGVCSFPDVESACNTVIATIQSGIPMARIELLDTLQMRACNAYSKLDYPEAPTLFLEFHGTTAGVKEQAELFGEIAEEFGGGNFSWTTRQEDRAKLWQARHDAYWAAISLRPGTRAFATDACVPISRLADCVRGTMDDIAELGLIAPIVGHVGDGNFHVSALIDMDDPAELEKAQQLSARISARAIGMDGTCTGEHGIGQGKRAYLEQELGPALDVMRAVKRAIDPQNIMNPGKIIRL